MNLEIIIPVYNEEKILEANTKLVLAYSQNNFNDWGLTLIINGSSDRSLLIAEELALNNPRIKVINLTEDGKGRALKYGLSQNDAKIILYMDIDLAVSLEDMAGLINLIKQGNDLALGSRLLPASQTERSALRGLSSKIYNRLANLILQEKISDWQCGFKAMNQAVVKTIVPLITNEQWFFDTELLALAKRFKFKIAELPVNWSENRYAVRQSKVHPFKDGLIFLKNLFKLRTRLKKI